MTSLTGPPEERVPKTPILSPVVSPEPKSLCRWSKLFSDLCQAQAALLSHSLPTTGEFLMLLTWNKADFLFLF